MVYCKRILILFFIFITLFCSISFSAQIVQPNENMNGQAVQYDNTYLTLNKMQLDVQNSAIAKLYTLYRANPSSTLNFLNQLYNELSGNYQKYIYVRANIDDSQYEISTYFYRDWVNSGVSNMNFNGTGFTNVSTKTGSLWSRFIMNDNTLALDVTSHSIKLADATLGIISPNWIQLFKDVGIINTSTSQAILDKLDELVTSSNNVSSINTTIREESEKINSTLEEQNKLQQESNDLQKEQNDFLKSEASDSDVDLSGFNTVDVDDPTSSFLTNIFNTIYNSITSWKSKDIVLPVPNTDENITIKADSTINFLNSINAKWVITIVSAVYYFIVARFIIFYIQRLIDSIKSGNILNSSKSDNITTDLL